MGTQSSLTIWLIKWVAWGFRRKVTIAERVRTPSQINFSSGNLGKPYRQKFAIIVVFYWGLDLEEESDLECLSCGRLQTPAVILSGNTELMKWPEFRSTLPWLSSQGVMLLTISHFAAASGDLLKPTDRRSPGPDQNLERWDSEKKDQ